MQNNSCSALVTDVTKHDAVSPKKLKITAKLLRLKLKCSFSSALYA